MTPPPSAKQIRELLFTFAEIIHGRPVPRPKLWQPVRVPDVDQPLRIYRSAVDEPEPEQAERE